MPAVYLNGSYSSSSFSHGADILPRGGGGGAALGISADFLVLGGGCEGKEVELHVERQMAGEVGARTKEI